MAEWLKATDCKSVLSRVRRFETCSAHSSFKSEEFIVVKSFYKQLNFLQAKVKSGSSSFGRAIAFQAIGGEFEPRLPLLLINDECRDKVANALATYRPALEKVC